MYRVRRGCTPPGVGVLSASVRQPRGRKDPPGDGARFGSAHALTPWTAETSAAQRRPSCARTHSRCGASWCRTCDAHSTWTPAWRRSWPRTSGRVDPPRGPCRGHRHEVGVLPTLPLAGPMQRLDHPAVDDGWRSSVPPAPVVLGHLEVAEPTDSVRVERAVVAGADNQVPEAWATHPLPQLDNGRRGATDACGQVQLQAEPPGNFGSAHRPGLWAARRPQFSGDRDGHDPHPSAR